VPLRRFRYDAKHDILKCPRGRILRPQRRVPHGRFFYSRSSDCRSCPIRGDCLSAGRVNKAVVVSDDHPALLRARRRKERWSKDDVRLLPAPWAVQRARYMTLETIAPPSDSTLVNLPAGRPDAPSPWRSRAPPRSYTTPGDTIVDGDSLASLTPLQDGASAVGEGNLSSPDFVLPGA
jgi:hypothetical protein